MRDECKGCICAGETVICKAKDLEWALYDLKKTIPSLRLEAEKPAPCWARDVESEEEQ